LARTKHEVHSAPRLAPLWWNSQWIQRYWNLVIAFKNCQNSKLMNLEIHAYTLGTECIAEKPKKKKKKAWVSNATCIMRIGNAKSLFFHFLIKEILIVHVFFIHIYSTFLLVLCMGGFSVYVYSEYCLDSYWVGAWDSETWALQCFQKFQWHGIHERWDLIPAFSVDHRVVSRELF
jgi:hypothetical protein